MKSQQIALVTASSQGIGAGIAQRLVDVGYMGKPIQDLEQARVQVQRHVRQEYQLFGFMIVSAFAYTFYTGDLFLIYAWLIPVVLVSEPVHYLIELPEHFGLDVLGDRNVNRNTRSIEANWFAGWFTNYSNLHTAHHAMAGTPMSKAISVHRACRHQMEVIEPSYWSFYSKVISGEVRPFNAAYR